MNLESHQAFEGCGVFGKKQSGWAAKANYKRHVCHGIATEGISASETGTLAFCPNGETGKRLRTREFQIYFQNLNSHNCGEDWKEEIDGLATFSTLGLYHLLYLPYCDGSKNSG
jgi:hypothetical protein